MDEILKELEQRFIESVEYIEDHDYIVMSDELPDRLLTWWTRGGAPYVAALGKTDIETAGKVRYVMSMLPALILGYVRTDLNPGEGTNIGVLAGGVENALSSEFVLLVEYIFLARHARWPVPVFNLFDFGRYAEIIEGIVLPENTKIWAEA